MATKIVNKEIRYEGGREGLLSGLGIFYLVISIITCFVAVVLAVLALNRNPDESLLWIALGIGSLIPGITSYIFCGALADVLRLLKKLAGEKYGGTVSQPDLMEYQTTICSQCGTSVNPSDSLCYRCQAVFKTNSGEQAIGEDSK
jgi:hypothetical protein